jgi:AcrR family transcriptional regulator
MNLFRFCPLNKKNNRMNVQSTDKKQVIFDVVLRLISEQGVQSTPMSQVAKEANVAAGTIYHYFESKEALLNELYVEQKRRMGEALRAESFAGSYKERFVGLWKSLYYYFLANPLSFVFSSQLAHSPLIGTNAKEEGKRHYQGVVDFIELGMQQGHLRSMDPSIVAELLYSTVVGALHVHFSGLEMTSDLVDQVAEFSWRGIASDTKG